MKKVQLLVIFSLTSILLCCKPKTLNLKPTLYTVGDSTVKNGKGDGYGGLWGWGDFIGQFLDSSKVKIENHALGGTSSRTYQNLGLWDAVDAKLVAGDYVLIQFGHNDNSPVNDTIRARGTIKGIGDETQEINNLITGDHEIVHSYGWYIEKIVKDAKAKGATPIIMSPIPRNKWVKGSVPRNDTSYGLWAKQIAERNNITFINLNDEMAKQLEVLGEEKVTGTYFYKRDHTHTSAKGAAMAAEIIVDALKQTDNAITDYFKENVSISYPKKKNIFLIGDSTMANNGKKEAVGWGVPFPQFCDTTQVNIINKARGGRSSRTFVNEGLWDAAKKEFTADDIVFIQFGHNDAGKIDQAKYRGSIKGIGNKTQEVTKDSVTETVHSYGWYLTKMIRETRDKGAIPIVLSITPRNEWANGVVEQRDSTFVKWAKQVAEAEKTLFVDLSDMVAKSYQKLGKENVKPFFPKDHTHTGLEGAKHTAKLFAAYLKQAKAIGLRGCVFIED
ncbi:MAG: rhamnogalacturonan acetylesterase [Winogradskyella sp.]|uniref:rhamnogalacturonan acetylesterase n=1 Tax=Winogradskyella sp. TaxID=1883156 RepID=UPI003859D066